MGQGSVRRPPQEGGHPAPLLTPLGGNLGTRRGRDAVPSGSPGSPAPAHGGDTPLPALRHICHGATRRAMPCNTVAALRKWRVLAWQREHEKYHRKNSGVVGEERFFSIYYKFLFCLFLKQFEVFCPLVSHAEVLLAL